ncbi:MAG: geranylgeranyl reductase family protein [Candidatus Hermodarchaeota archaeon]
MNSYDLVIIGAGTSSTIAAQFAASNGLKVCLIDAHKKEEIGDKTCGDVVLATIFDFLKLNPPQGSEILSLKKMIKFYASDLEHHLTIKMPIYLVDRLQFGQKLLRDALDSGVAEFLDNTKVVDLSYKNGSVNGVIARLKTGEKVAINAKIVVDGSGVHSIVRKKIKSNIIQNEISQNDVVICYREIIQIEDNMLPTMPTDSLTVAFDPDNIPGGYFWYFPKSDTKINLGAGVLLRQKKDLKHIYRDYISNKFLSGRKYKILSSRGDIVPIRRPLPSCADNGIMFIGDTGCHVNTANGGGIHTGMKAGYYAAMIAKKAIEAEDYSLSKLWEYNCLLMNDFGIGHATNDIARILLQHTKTRDFDYIIKKKLIDDAELTQMYYSNIISPSMKEIMVKFFKGISKPKLLLKLGYLLKQMNQVNHLYLKYPRDVNGYKPWRELENDLFNKVYLKIIGND